MTEPHLQSASCRPTRPTRHRIANIKLLTAV